MDKSLKVRMTRIEEARESERTPEVHTEAGKGRDFMLVLLTIHMFCLTDIREGGEPCCALRVQEGEGDPPEAVQGSGACEEVRILPPTLRLEVGTMEK